MGLEEEDIRDRERQRWVDGEARFSTRLGINGHGSEYVTNTMSDFNKQVGTPFRTNWFKGPEKLCLNSIP